MIEENRNKIGRPKGSKNINTQKIRSAFQLLISNNLEQLQEDINSLTPRDRCSILIALSRQILPQLKSVDLTTNPTDSFKPIEIHFNTDAN